MTKLFSLIRFAIWRWWMVHFGARRVVNKASAELRWEYEDYRQACQSNRMRPLSFEEWCGHYDVKGVG